MEKEERHLEKEKKKWKDQQVTKGYDRPDKFIYPDEEKEEDKKSKKKQKA